jgi:hypothetical protein
VPLGTGAPRPGEDDIVGRRTGVTKVSRRGREAKVVSWGGEADSLSGVPKTDEGGVMSFGVMSLGVISFGVISFGMKPISLVESVEAEEGDRVGFERKTC